MVQHNRGSTDVLTADESKVLEAFRRAQAYKHSEMAAYVKDGVLVRLHVVEKVDLGESWKAKSVATT